MSKSVSFHLKYLLLDYEGRYIMLTGDLNPKPYTIVFVYTPNFHQLRVLQKGFKLISLVKYEQLLRCGDFNMTVDPYLDSSSTTKKRHLSPQNFSTERGVYDVWWCQYSNERDYTSFSRIDVFLTDQWLLQSVSSSCIHNVTWSDHADISLVMEKQEPLSRSSLFLCNVKVLQDTTVPQVVSQHLWDYFVNNQYSVSDSYVLWNSNNAYIQGICIQQRARVKKQYNKIISNLLYDIYLLESQNKTSPCPSTLASIVCLRGEPGTLLVQKYDQHLRYLKLTHHANKAGKYLANSLKTIQARTRIPHLQHPTLICKITNPQP